MALDHSSIGPGPDVPVKCTLSRRRDTDLQTTKIDEDEVGVAAVETRHRHQEVGRLQVDPQVQNFPGLYYVGQT